MDCLKTSERRLSFTKKRRDCIPSNASLDKAVIRIMQQLEI